MINDKYRLKNGMIVKQISEVSDNNIVMMKIISCNDSNVKFGGQLGLIVDKPGDWPKGGILQDGFDVIEKLK